MTRQTHSDVPARMRWQHLVRWALVLAIIVLMASAVLSSSGHRSPQKTWLRIIGLVVVVSLLVLHLYRDTVKRSDRPVFSLERNRWLLSTLFGPSVRRMLGIALLVATVYLAHLIANFILYGRPWQ